MALNPYLAATHATRTRWEARYREGERPWDTRQTPPEVIAFWAANNVPRNGQALDLGCGPGTNVRYLARLGLSVIGVEIAGPALTTAQARLQREEPFLASKARFICADVCFLPFRGIDANYILDVGCLHSIDDDMRPHYVQSVVQNLAPGGFYQLYAFDRVASNPPQSGPGGLEEGEIAARFGPYLTLVEVVIAVPERRPCRWYLLRRAP